VTDRTRLLAFGGLSVVVAAGVAVYLHMARLKVDANLQPGTIPTVRVPQASAVRSVRGGPHVVFRSVPNGAANGTLSFAPLPGPGDRRYSTSLVCDRLYFSERAGVCIMSERKYHKETLGYVVDDQLTVRRTFSAVGGPSRVRLSGDGRRAAYTVFTARDSYMAVGFSTRTYLLDLTSEEAPVDLETFEVTKDGEAFRSSDFNFWGVTFSADADRFYATLSTRGHLYLVAGNAATKRMEVVRDGIECPSLSPDGGRVAFKKRLNPKRWRPAVLDLASGEETVLPELRNVDDQLEWLDEAHVLYAIRTWTGKSVKSDIWQLAVDGSSPPALFLADAESPSVINRGPVLQNVQN
jgi:dipeptidyl aminopeptidase/acylaminoacyl peptidase